MLVSDRHCAHQKPNPNGRRKGRRGEIAASSYAENQALVSAWQTGTISRDTLLYNLRTGGIVPPARMNKQELELIGADPPRDARTTRSPSSFD